MLSPKERKEFIRDGLDMTRREAFRQADKVKEPGSWNTEVYLKFLSQVHQIFSSVNPIVKKPVIYPSAKWQRL